ncbi:RICIN domain-containing protein [Streptoalloteichus hindustanus]|uniref:RICIN domain-containing protein n=1 Tax=Streptoalloteichus hindustanus TaxID=2017 RepID=UPI00093756FA|nr:RICIN domain-containing protein [Streptoalloteichus hindustanus]
MRGIAASAVLAATIGLALPLSAAAAQQPAQPGPVSPQPNPSASAGSGDPKSPAEQKPLTLAIGTLPDKPELAARQQPAAAPAPQSTDVEKGKAAAELGIVAGPELLVLNDRNFTAAMYYAADDLDKPHPLEPEHQKVKEAAIAALGANDDECTTFIRTGMAAANKQDQQIVAERRKKQEEDRAVKAKAAGALGIKVDDAVLSKSVYDFIVHLELNADNHKDAAVKEAARAALKGTAEAQWTFLTVGVFDEHKKDVDRLIQEDKDKTEAEKAAALSREAKANAAWHALGIKADDALLNLSDQDFVIEIWNRAPRDTEVHGAAEAAVRSRNPADWKYFIDKGAKEAHLRDIENALKKRDDEYIRQIGEIRTRAVKSLVRPALVAAADAALAGSPVDRERFVRVGQHQHLTQSLRAITSLGPDIYLTDSNGDAVLKEWQPGDRPEQAWKIEAGLSDPTCFSFQSVTRPNNYLHWRKNAGGHYRAFVGVDPSDGSNAFKVEATWCVRGGGNTVVISPVSAPNKYLFVPGVRDDEGTAGPAVWNVESPQPPTPFDRRYASDQKLRDSLGKPVRDPVLDKDNLGYREYEKGRLYRTRNDHGDFVRTDVHVVYNGPVLDKLVEMGGPNALGGKFNDQAPAKDGKGQVVRVDRPRAGGQNLYIIWSQATGAHEVHGLIGETWAKAGGETGPFGYPTTDESGFGSEGNRFNHFTGGSIYYLPKVGIRTTRGEIHQKFASLGRHEGPLGHPVGEETTFGTEGGRFQRFATGSVYYTPKTGAVAIHGEFHKKFAEFKYEAGPLGYPLNEAAATSDGVGRYINFSQGGGGIYWHPATGAHLVYGAIRGKWNELGAEKSYLGYPTTDEFDLPKGRRNVFQGGRIDWSNDGGHTIAYKVLTMTPGAIALRGVQSGRCLQVAGINQDAHADLAGTEIWDCIGGAPKQIWDLVSLGDNKYALKNRNSGKCLDLRYGDLSNTTPIVQYSCHYGSTQQWEFTTAADNTVALRSVHSAKVADVIGPKTENGAYVGHYADLAGVNQRWTVIQVSTTK